MDVTWHRIWKGLVAKVVRDVLKIIKTTEFRIRSQSEVSITSEKKNRKTIILYRFSDIISLFCSPTHVFTSSHLAQAQASMILEMRTKTPPVRQEIKNIFSWKKPLVFVAGTRWKWCVAMVGSVGSFVVVFVVAFVAASMLCEYNVEYMVSCNVVN